MVMRNYISRSAGNSEYVSPRCRPRKFLFNVGDYEVALKKKPSYEKGSDFIHVQIWHEKNKVGYIDLVTQYYDVKTIMSVHTMLNRDYQGLGIAYRVYEGLINEANISLTSDNQSPGAVKLWKRFAKNRSLRVYHVSNRANELFESLIYPVVLNEKRELELINYINGNASSPYHQHGQLLLVRRQSVLDKSIQKHIALHTKIHELAKKIKPFDKFGNLG